MNLRADQRGLVSLLTTVLISMLLLVVTMSLISLEALQLRKAEDSEQTLRAYYAAEAGVEDAVSKVLAKTVTGDQTCSSPGAKNINYDIPGAAGWTCQQISFSGSPTGKLEKPDAAKTIDPGDMNYQSVEIEWNQSSQTNASFYNVLLGGGYPDATYYLANYAAPPLELTIVEYPKTGFASDEVCSSRTNAGVWQPAGCQVKLQNALLTPGGSVAAVHNYGANALYHPASALRGNCTRLPRNAGARPNPYNPGSVSDYNCYAIISNLPPSKNFLYRLRSRYMPSSYKLTFWSSPTGLGNKVDVPDGTATIDVTAKAGQTYRRVISKLPLNAGAASGLNFVMYSDNDICKNFDVFDNSAVTGCPYLP